MRTITKKKVFQAAATTFLMTIVALVVLAASDEKLEIKAAATETMEVLLEARQPVRWVPGQVIVKFKEGAELPAGAQIEGLGMSDEGTVTTSGGEKIFMLPLDMSTAALTSDASKRTYAVAQAMSARPEVEYAQVNYIVDIAADPNDQGYASQWHYFNNGTGAGESPGGINLPQAWDVSTGDADVVVAVIDTGILPGHPDISGSPNQAGGYDMITSVFTSNDGDGRDADPTDAGDAVTAGECPPLFVNPPSGDSWHGTHVAGTIGAGITDNVTGVAGINWQVRVISVRVLGKCGGSISDINDAIRWAAGMPVPGVPNNPTPANVINMSLGAATSCSNSPATQAAISDVVSRNVTVVVAAGNDAQNAANAMPASCNGVIAVAASDEDGALVTRYSNFGNVVDIMAPGGDTQGSSGSAGGVLSTVQGGYAFYNGTSMASPHVAGVAALMLAVTPGISPQSVENRLETTAMPRSAAQCPQPCGAGLLDAFAAIDIGPKLGVSPRNISFGRSDTVNLVATVTDGGMAVPGQDVSFLSSTPANVTVSAATVPTDANGKAQVTVTGVQKGNANITVATVGGVTTVPVTVNVAVTPVFGGLMLALLLAALLLLYFRRVGRPARRNRFARNSQ